MERGINALMVGGRQADGAVAETMLKEGDMMGWRGGRRDKLSI